MKFDIPWVEKYRPQIVGDIILNDSVYERIYRIIKAKKMPNLIVTGVPGIGKTTTIQCICRHLFGKYSNNAVLELNASDDRGIKTVHDSIEHFCKKKVVLPEDYAQHKVVVLDEADNMTPKAQQLINNLIETYPDMIRFAFTCNNSQKIIETIQSKCVIFRYASLTNSQIMKRLEQVCKIEKLKYDNDGLNSIIFVSQGDLRRALNYLQLTNTNYGEINMTNVYKLCDKPHPHIIKYIIDDFYNQKLTDSYNKLKNLLNKGYSNSDIISGMINVLKYFPIKDIDEYKKITLINEICKTSIVIDKGIDTELQIVGCLFKLSEISKKLKNL